MNRRFGNKAPSKAAQRIRLMQVAQARETPLTDSERVSLSRSSGLGVSEIDSIFAAARERRQA